MTNTPDMPEADNQQPQEQVKVDITTKTEEVKVNVTTKSSPRWYAVQVASGCEKRVKTDIDMRIQTLEISDRIIQVQIPQTPSVKIRKDGSRYTSDEKVFPGYVLVKMLMDDDAWQVIKNTPNVINFVGAEQKRRYGRGRGHVKPLPLSRAEVERIFKQSEEQEPVIKIDMEIGDKIAVLSGPFKEFQSFIVYFWTRYSSRIGV